MTSHLPVYERHKYLRVQMVVFRYLHNLLLKHPCPFEGCTCRESNEAVRRLSSDLKTSILYLEHMDLDYTLIFVAAEYFARFVRVHPLCMKACGTYVKCATVLTVTYAVDSPTECFVRLTRPDAPEEVVGVLYGHMNIMKWMGHFPGDLLTKCFMYMLDRMQYYLYIDASHLAWASDVPMDYELAAGSHTPRALGHDQDIPVAS